MNCFWEETNEPLDANGYRLVRCKRLECGITVRSPMPLEKIQCDCKAHPGPGTHLKAILDWWGYHDNGKCGCQAFAAQMDAWGPDGCEQHMAEILDHLEKAAAEQGVAFVRAAAWLLVLEAIRRARVQ